MALQLLNILLFGLHSAVIGLNLFGWMFKRTWRLALGVTIVTLASWLIAGLWFGVGFCFLTEVHWSVRRAMGITDDPDSYVALMLRDIFGISASSSQVAALAGGLFAVAIVGTIFTNVRDIRARRATLARP